MLTRQIGTMPEILIDRWTDSEHVMHRLGQRSLTTTIHEIDVRPSAVWHFVIHGPDGVDCRNEAVPLEVVKPERLVYFQGSGEADDPEQLRVTLTFAERDGKAEPTMRSLFPTAEAREHVVSFGATDLA